MRQFSIKVLLLTLLISPVLHAQEPKHDLERAFYKEYSFLLKEKKAMQSRIQQLKSKQQAEQKTAQQELEMLQSESDALRLEADRINDQIAVVERETLAKASNQGVFEATLEQASATLKQPGDPKLTGIEETISEGVMILKQNTSIHTKPNQAYFLQDGSEITGDIVYYGGVARFGLSNQGQGPLAPAGGGAFKLWEQDDSGSIEALAAGNLPETIPLFLFDSPTQEVAFVEDKEVMAVINSGGIIAWIIVGLGGIATLLALLRAFFLFGLGRSSRKEVVNISESVAQGNLDQAKQQANRIGGSIKRVLSSTLSNLHRDREHVEDIISEAIIHEHTHLDRFHALIMVVAAISPLLGLLGTVTGMIETFDIITEFGTGDPKLLSGGISIALVTTELGLIVAIPVLVVGTILSSWSNRIKDELERSALHVVNQYQNHRSVNE
ncbi:flagellar motor protein MotA [Hydrogenovibrio sp. SC-1]|uniref:MotA/TolQ/ExbB proton channel family protein n=1 Tax=Hydrogenovibrio sp. SC-1 TaxID=2065820 RepID=UPI000C7D26F9|nr:MotA/TolQ/ExbB proton channel family protein [Hydrogenovibrio sp. SC-1]PLA75349.1 flagellar motor protein MotA [Hydrogenovibrio sp. SC-1]